MAQGLIHGEGVHLSAVIKTGFDSFLQIMAGGLNRQRISDHFAGEPVVFDPSRVRQGDPDGSSVHQELHIDGIGMPRGHGNDQGLIKTVDLFARPAIGGKEIIVHVSADFK